eukprot:g15974.t1
MSEARLSTIILVCAAIGMGTYLSGSAGNIWRKVKLAGTSAVHMLLSKDQNSKPEVRLGIKELRDIEADLKKRSGNSTSPVVRDAKVNILKYLQIQTVLNFEAAYDALYYELSKDGGLECLLNIAPVQPKELLQPKVLELQGCDKDARLAKQLEFYLADAELAKQRLDDLVTEVAQDSEIYEVQRVEVKSRESTQRKASRFCGGDVRKVADMARVAVVCNTPEALEQAYLEIKRLVRPQDILRVKNSFSSDWVPSGYRDVKVNPVVDGHLCEIQLQLSEFFTLKSDQHAVYEWARDLDVNSQVHAVDLFKNLSAKVTKEMICLARKNWHGTRVYLPELQLAAGQYNLAEEGLRQQLMQVNDLNRRVEDNDSKERRKALLLVNRARSRLGTVLAEQGKYAEADLQYLGVLKVAEKELGPDHPDVAAYLNNRAGLLRAQGKFAEAEPLYERCQTIKEKILGPGHPSLALTLNNRASLLGKMGKYTEAGPLYERCQAIKEKVLGPEHPSLGTTLNNRALLLEMQGKFDEAESLYRRCLATNEKALGTDHPTVATYLNNWAGLLRKQGKDDEAETLQLRALAIREKYLAPDDPNLSTSLNDRAVMLENQGKYAEAERLYERCQMIKEKNLGRDHPDFAITLINRAGLLKNQGKMDEADDLYARAADIFENAMGSDHPHVATALNNWAVLLESQGKVDEAESMYKRSLAIDEKTLGPDHPGVATDLNNLAAFLDKHGKNAEAQPLYERCQAIEEKILGPEHPTLATTLINRAYSLTKQDKYAEAFPLVERALAIRMNKLGENDTQTVNTRIILECVQAEIEDKVEAAACDRRHCTREEQDGGKG